MGIWIRINKRVAAGFSAYFNSNQMSTAETIPSTAPTRATSGEPNRNAIARKEAEDPKPIREQPITALFLTLILFPPPRKGAFPPAATPAAYLYGKPVPRASHQLGFWAEGLYKNIVERGDR